MVYIGCCTLHYVNIMYILDLILNFQIKQSTSDLDGPESDVTSWLPTMSTPVFSAGGMLNFWPNFQKQGLDRISSFRGGC